MKRIFCYCLILCLVLALACPALAVAEGEQRVVIGADLTEEQIQTVYGLFGISRGSVTELAVTNAEERDYLEGLVSEDVIGHNSISCVYIRTLPAGSGLTVSCSNIDWCTEDMYRAALMTAGIQDAEVKVAAPFPVSGTAALTGIYKAYESITGVGLAQEAKTVATDELVITAQLADQVSDMDAVSIVGELKGILDQTQNMSDDELRTQIVSIAGRFGYTLDDGTITRLIGLCRSLEGLSDDELQSQVEQLQDSLETVSQYAGQVQDFGDRVYSFFQGISDFFFGIFG